MHRYSVSALVGLLLMSACRQPDTETGAHAIVFDQDDRAEVYTFAANHILRERTEQSVVALIDESLVELSGSNVTIESAGNLGVAENLCAGSRFEDQQRSASCSGVLIDDDLVLTAGHCIDAASCPSTRFVFGFFYDQPGQLKSLTTDDVFSCASVVTHRLSGDLVMSDADSNGPWDYAIVRLDRSATPRFVPAPVHLGTEPAVGTPSLVGFPSAIPAKIVESGTVAFTRATVDYDTFGVFLDGFVGNSGGPIFDGGGNVVGVAARSSYADFVPAVGASCNLIAQTPSSGLARHAIEGSYAKGAVGDYCASGQTSSRLCIGNCNHDCQSVGVTCPTTRSASHCYVAADLCADTRTETCNVGTRCIADVGCRRPKVLVYPAEADVRAECMTQNGQWFPPNTNVRLYFQDAVAGTVSSENVVITDANGVFEWSFGLDCNDADARNRAQAYLDRVDPDEAGFDPRLTRYWATYEDLGVHVTAAYEYLLDARATCIPQCSGMTCGDNGCGGNCGNCAGANGCVNGGCANLGLPGLSTSGSINGNTTWSLADSPVLVTDTVTVNGSLTIAAGVTVMFQDSNDSLIVASGGALTAVADAASPIVFTSDGETTPGAWGRVSIRNGAGAVQMNYVEMRHGGGFNGSERTPLIIDGRVTPSITRLDLHDNVINGVGLYAGSYTSDVRLTVAETPYWVESDVTIEQGATLTIDPGVIVKFSNQYGDMFIRGRMIANATAASPIFLTSWRDDARGGDTNADGPSIAQRLDWGGLRFENPSTQLASILRNVVINYAGSNARVFGGSGGGHALWADGRSRLTIDSVTMAENRANGISVAPGTYNDSFQLDVTALPYWVTDDVIVGSGATLTITDGVVMKFEDQYDDLRIDGRLLANGMPNRPVVFTSARDDARGGDTNADGNTAPDRANWGGIRLANNTANPSTLANVVIAYAGSNASVFGGSGLGYPLLVDARLQPSVTGLVFDTCTINGVSLMTGTYAQNTFLNIIGNPYWIDNDITVNPSTTMTINAGVTVKFQDQYDDLRILGRLVADGTTNAPIVFTAGADDARGGDTNGDGASVASASSWGGLLLAYDASTMQSTLTNVVLSYGGSTASVFGGSGLRHTLLVDPRMQPQISAITFTDNRVNGISLITGTYSADTRLNVVAAPYFIENDLNMNPSTTMTIDPGVTVKFEDQLDDLRIWGRLIAEGTTAEPIIFTSARDDARGGDTNNDGSTAPGTQNWGGIHLDFDGTLPPSSLSDVIISYGGSTTSVFGGSGLGHALLVDGRTQPTMTSVLMHDNRVNGVSLETGSYSAAARLNVTELPYWIDNDVVINAGATLTIDPGVTIKFQDVYDDIYVSGRLIADGTAGQPIVLTAARDDARLGDTNNDGTTAPGPSSWGGVHIGLDASQPASSLRNVVFNYGGSSATAFGVSGLGYPLRVDPRTQPVLDALVMTNNRVNGIAVLPGAYSTNIALDATTLPYWLDNDITVNQGVTFTLGAGVIIKFQDQYDDVIVNGRLIASGTAGAPIRLTSARDDAFGGDTNGDGSTAPAARDWGGIALNNNAVQEASVLDNVILTFGGSNATVFGASGLGYPLRVDGRVAPEVGALSIANSRINGAGLVTGSYNANVRLNITAVPYWIAADTVINSGVTITVDPGVIVKFADGDTDLFVDGRMIAAGSVAQPIQFTSASDDAAGGDTNNDGSTAPSPGQWGGLVFRSSGADSRLSDARVAFAGRGGRCALDVHASGLRVERVHFDRDEDAICLYDGLAPDLGGGALTSAGGNTFTGHVAGTGNWAVWNATANAVFALSNSWSGLNTPAAIDQIIFDQLDDAARGRVLFNAPPTANPQSVTTPEDVPLDIVLSGADPDGNPLGFQIDQQPSSGTISGTAPNVTYTPDPDFSGQDSFTFVVADGAIDSAPATVTITVTAVNDAPVANPLALITDEDTPIAVALSGSDVDGDALTFSVVSTPSRGSLSGAVPDLTYTPDADAFGGDSFVFDVTDGSLTTTATITIDVQPINDAPVASDAAVATVEDTSVSITLAATDVENDTLTFMVGAPDRGTITGLAPNVTYVPAPDDTGTARFTFTVSDGAASDTATVTVTITAVNDPPVAIAQDVSTLEDLPLDITLTGQDADGDTLLFAVVTQPQGRLTGTAPALQYLPPADYAGADSFTFTVSDGTVTSSPAVVSIDVRGSNDPPVAHAFTATTAEDVPLALTLSATDPDLDTLVLSITSSPASGRLTGTPPALVYEPDADFFGSDRFVFAASDGITSTSATVSLTITAVNDRPIANDLSSITSEDTALALVLTASDVDGDALTLSITGAPESGTLTGTPPNVTYLPDPNFAGTDRFTFVATDGQITSGTATVTIEVLAENDPPIALSMSATSAEDTALIIELGGTDVDSDLLTFTITSSPQSGALSGTPPSLTYTPSADFFGTDVVMFVVSDGRATSATATFSITVTPVADPPVAMAATITTVEDTSVVITLNGSDPDGDALQMIVDRGPTQGTLTGTPPVMTYTPAANYAGPDSFTFFASDGGLRSLSATISIDVRTVNDAPVAMSAAATTPEDEAVTIELVATDADGDALSFTIVGQPTIGRLSGAGSSWTYTPDADANGTDRFVFTAFDGLATSNTATITVTITPVNDPPRALATSTETDEDTSVAITLSAVDVDDSVLQFAVVLQPMQGSLTGTPPNVVYTPGPDFAGADRFTFTASDGATTSNEASVDVIVRAVNDAPIAQSTTATTAEDVPVSVSLTGTDADGDTLSFAIVDPPTIGRLSGAGSSWTYTPDADANGTDRFVFTAFDGLATSNTATITVTITPVNDPPRALATSTETDEDTSVAITLSAVDVDDSVLQFAVVLQPMQGSLTGTPPNVVYTPGPDFAGADRFTFTASDGATTSNEASVDVIVRAVNDAPIAQSTTATTAEDVPVSVSLTGTDADGDTLSFAIVDPPANGTLTGAMPNLIYTPDPDFFGTDTWTFSAHDGQVSSSTATVTIEVQSVNDGPVASSLSATVVEDRSVAIALSGTDRDGDALTYVIATPPMQGRLTGVPPAVTYAPNADYFGSDAFTFTVSDGQIVSAAATVSIMVTPVNDVPVALAGSATTSEDVPVRITLAGADADGDALTFAIVSSPLQGGLTGAPPSMTFEPTPDAWGSDSFTFTVSDGISTSAPATYSLTVTPVDDAPVARSSMVSTMEDIAVSITLSATDGDGDALTFTIDTPPVNGQLSGTAPMLVYTPNADYLGADLLTFRASDGRLTSDTATITINITPVNDPPVADAVSVSTDEDQAVAFTLTATDPDGDTLTFTVEQQPMQGRLTGVAPALTYEPNPDSFGVDTFTFVASDGVDRSAPATVRIEVMPVPDPPVADAGADQLVDERSTVQLDGRGSTDPDGDPITLVWTQVDGPQVELVGARTATPTFAAPRVQQGSVFLKFELTVDDDGGLSAQDVVDVEVANSTGNTPPVALIIGPTQGAAGETVTLDGSRSDDPDGDAITYRWSQSAGPAAMISAVDAQELQVTLPAAGESVRVDLIVNDGLVNSPAVEHAVTIESISDEPPPEGCSCRAVGSTRGSSVLLWIVLFALALKVRPPTESSPPRPPKRKPITKSRKPL